MTPEKLVWTDVGRSWCLLMLLLEFLILTFNVYLSPQQKRMLFKTCLQATGKKSWTFKMKIANRHTRQLPSDQYIVHFEFANFFHPMSDTLPGIPLGVVLECSCV